MIGGFHAGVMDDLGGRKTSLLESTHITVTDLTDGPVPESFDVVKHKCRCWFCPDCCRAMGRMVRARLAPILETFSGLLLVTFTVDPSLFKRPSEAYFYMRQRRCVARTIQDLFRKGFLHSRRYFYVVEWQHKTQQAHFHVLLDASFVPWTALLASWDKHRPDTAGPVVGSRPKFGTVLISMPKFAGGSKHAASYVTKYLTKMPGYGFPDWVLEMGEHARIRRYSASRGFWGEPSKPPKHDAQYKPEHKTYRHRIAQCGNTVDVFERRIKVDKDTGEIHMTKSWLGELDLPFSSLENSLRDPRSRPTRRGLDVENLEQVIVAVESAAGCKVQWKRGGPVKMDAEAKAAVPWEERAEREHRDYLRNYDTMIRKFLELRN